MITGNPDLTREASSRIQAQERGKAARCGTASQGTLPGNITCVLLLHLSGDLFLGPAAFL